MSSEASNEQAAMADIPQPTTPAATAPKRRSRRRGVRDKNAPAAPGNAYTIFVMERRPLVAQERTDLAPNEVNRQVGVEWKALPSDQKDIYYAKAKARQEQYLKEMEAYKKTDSYKNFRASAKRMKVRKKEQEQESEFQEDGIPVFSKEFLELNRQRESELRNLRVEVVRLEEEQAALDDSINRLKKATEQLDMEMQNESELDNKIRGQLDAYRRTLVQAFAHMPFPGTNHIPTMETIDNYMSDIHKLVLEAAGEHQDFVAKVRDIVTKLKMPS